MSKPTVSANSLSIVHAGSKGKLTCTIPDVCCIPTPSGKTPVPFPNTAESKDLSGGTATVKIEGNSVAVMGSNISTSKGDAGGVLGGVVSGGTQGKATTIMFSPDVLMEMRPVIRKTDPAIMNDINTVCLSGWDQGDLSGAEAKEWVKIKLLDDDGVNEPKIPVPNAKVNVTLPDGSTREMESGPNGVITFLDIDPGSCSLELNEPDDSAVREFTDRWPSSNLATKRAHKVGVVVEKRPGSSY